MTDRLSSFPGSYPTTRMRRNRRDDWTRRLVAENKLSADDLIWPVFVHDGDDARTPVPSLPGIDRLSIKQLVADVGEAKAVGIPLVAIFPAVDPALKTAEAEEAYNPDNLICRAVKAVKEAHPDMGIMCDVALDPFTSHGHDGLLRDGYIVNDETIEVLCKQTLVQARAGCDVIAPSDMMDGRIAAVRGALDAEGFETVAVLSYAAKFASAFYGPFREAAESAPSFGDRKTYQMDPANRREALREVELDVLEGADMVMVKPAVPYLDVLSDVAETFGLPTAAYHVSGEYAMIRAAAERGWIDGDRVLMETLLAIRRAGADLIVTYGAVDAARLAKQGWEP